MRPINEDEELFFKRINSMKEKAINNNQLSMLKFLDLRKQDICKYIIGNSLFLYFNGGYKDSEYKKCIISPFELNDPDFKIDILKIDYNHKYLTLNHRKVLACLLDLGIKREVIGDIVFDNDNCYIVVSSEMTNYIINNLRTISHNPVCLSIYDNEINNSLNYSVKKVFVTSLRIDSVISAMYNVSRNLSQQMIKSGNVKVNQMEITNISHLAKLNDIFSVRGKGRFKILEILGQTRSERIILSLGKLV